MCASDLHRSALRPEQKKILLGIARQSMETAVRREPRPRAVTSDPDLLRPAGAFCTLTIEGELRGCVGFFEPVHPLIESVSRASLKAALEDHRFPPVTESELRSILIEVSVLSGKEAIRSPDEIEVGRDGLILESPSVRGLLLPQVAAENGWDAKTFIVHLFRKCGLGPSPIDAPGITISRFEAEVFSELPHPGEPARGQEQP
jgi:AmmeMemoRadiSam system protein A